MAEVIDGEAGSDRARPVEAPSFQQDEPRSRGLALPAPGFPLCYVREDDGTSTLQQTWKLQVLTLEKLTV
jgi:hypothetical protein